MNRRSSETAGTTVGARIVIGLTVAFWLGVAVGPRAVPVRAAEKTAGPNGEPASKRVQPVRSLAFSPDGKWLAVGAGERGEQGELTLWDLATLKPLWVHRETGGVASAAFSPDGKYLALAAFGPEAKLLDAATGKVRRTFAGHTEDVRCVAFAPDGNTLATASYDGTIKLWELATGAEKRTLAGHTDRIFSIAVSPDGTRLLSSSPDYSVRLWDLTSGKELRSFRRQGSNVAPTVDFAPNGRWTVIGDWDGHVRIREADSGELRALMQQTSVDCVDFAPDGRHLAVSGAYFGVAVYRLRLRDPKPEEVERIERLIGRLNDDSYAVREKAGQELKSLGLIAVPRLKQAVRSAPVGVRVLARRILREVGSPEPLVKLSLRTDNNPAVAFSPNGQLIAAGAADGTTELWDLPTRRTIAVLPE